MLASMVAVAHVLRPESKVVARWRGWIGFSAPFLVAAAAYLAVVLPHVWSWDVATNVDFWHFTAIGLHLDPTRPETVGDGYYPVGLPAILRLAIDRGVDPLRVGQALSVLGGLCLLFGAMALTWDLSRERWPVAFTAALLLLHGTFLTYATQEGTDMPSAGLQLVSLACLWFALKPARERSGVYLAAAAGLAGGAAYLVRYTALIPVAIGFGVLLASLPRTRRRGLVVLAAYVAGFLVASAPQTVSSLLAHHQPFYTIQAKNVWWYIYGEGNWLGTFGKVPDDIPLFQVIALDPRRFVEHWFGQIAQFFLFDPLWFHLQWPSVFNIVWLIGLLAFLVGRRVSIRHRALLALCLLGGPVAIGMASVMQRFLLPTLALQAVLISWLIWRLAFRLPLPRLTAMSGAFFVLILLDQMNLVRGVERWIQAPRVSNPVAVTRILRAAGMRDPGEVVTNDPFLHAVDLPGRDQYFGFPFIPLEPASLDELLSQPAAAHWRFLVINPLNITPGDYGAVFREAEAGDPRLMPLPTVQPYAIYCLRPCQ
jgi:hypothetical protein